MRSRISVLLALCAGSASFMPLCASAELPGRVVHVPAGQYTRFFRGSGSPSVAVPAFWLDTEPVSRGDYLAFVRLHPEWRKSKVPRLFAEASYLNDWPSDFDPGEGSQPVTFVSWFAARAYCQSLGKRLPDVAEWERVAGGGTKLSALSPEMQASRTPFRFAMGQPAADLKASGFAVGGVWEWNADFNSAVVSGRADAVSTRPSSLFCGDGARSSNPSDYAAFLRYSMRSSLHGNYALKNLGFRCAKDGP